MKKVKFKTTILKIQELPKRAVIQIIRGYKYFISPLLSPACRFNPTCSEYAIKAIKKYGLIKGGALACWRIIRCNPFCRGGDDPVP